MMTKQKAEQMKNEVYESFDQWCAAFIPKNSQQPDVITEKNINKIAVTLANSSIDKVLGLRH